MEKQMKSARQQHVDPISRRYFLSRALTACAAAGLIENSWAQGLSGPKRSPMVMIEEFSASGKSLGRMQVARVVKSAAEWRKQLPADSYEVTRKEGTERPGSGKYLNNHVSGIYRCICRETAVFDAQTKFESGTG
jgi:peptide-methionine (R)-S-oxide reductase